MNVGGRSVGRTLRNSSIRPAVGRRSLSGLGATTRIASGKCLLLLKLIGFNKAYIDQEQTIVYYPHPHNSIL